jgi:hypothetical protein
MGWVEQRGNKYRLSFRYGGKIYRHSLGVETQREADESLASYCQISWMKRVRRRLVS